MRKLFASSSSANSTLRYLKIDVSDDPAESPCSSCSAKCIASECSTDSATSATSSTSSNASSARYCCNCRCISTEIVSLLIRNYINKLTYIIVKMY